MSEIETIALPFQTLSRSENIDAELTPEQSQAIGLDVIAGYDTDLASRAGWEKQYQNSQKLALQVVETKTWPWENASNIKFPLLTVATLQFAARAYGALLRGPEIVRCRVIGEDRGGQKRARAARVSQHMSYQMVEECESWEEETDRLLMTVPIIGCSFKKTYFDPVRKHNYSEHVSAWDLIVNYHARSLASAERVTHRFHLYEREIRERQLSGVYSDVPISLGSELAEPGQADQRQGIAPARPDAKSARLILEQHRWYDFDADGYPEPYCVTVEHASRKVLRIVARFERVRSEQSVEGEQLARDIAQLNGAPEIVAQAVEAGQRRIAELKAEPPRILAIEPVQYFTKYPFIPAPDGGFYDLGFGALLGPINESVNSIVNQLVDSGTLQNLQAGFIGKGARIKGGAVRFAPGEWKRADVAGSTLRESVVPLPVPPPSVVLFQLLGLLIQYGERIASVNDVMMGENVGQNTPAYNMQSMLQQGMAVFSGIFKRLWRSQRDEFRLWYRLNGRYLPEESWFQINDGTPLTILRADYQGDPTDIRPTADPNAALSEEKMRQVSLLAARAAQVPGYDMAQVELRILAAAGVDAIGEIYPTKPDANGRPQPAISPPPNPEIMVKIAEEQRRVKEADDRAKVGEAEIEFFNAQTVKTLAEAGAIGYGVVQEEGKQAIERLKIRQKAMETIINADREKRAGRMAAAPGNGTGSRAP